MRKLFFLFLALFATTSLWAHDFEVDGIYYNYLLGGNKVEVTYRHNFPDDYDNEYAGAVIIPSTVTYYSTTYSVTSIGDDAFQGCSSLTSVTIPNSVTRIGISAFQSCSSLTSITIPNSVTSIEYAAFYNCSSLTSVTIGNSVTSIGNSAFDRCSFLTSITCLGTTPPTLGTDVFYGTKLSAVYIPDNTLSAYQQTWGTKYAYVNNETTLTLHVATPGTLSDLIFDAGTRPVLVAKLTLTGTLNDADFTCMRETMISLVNVDLSGITNTSGVNFKGKARLVRIILPTNLTSIGDYAFYNCNGLTSITIPNSVTSIGYGAFDGCYLLPSVTIPNSVTSIGAWAFSNCYSLISVTIPNSVTTIGGRAFDACSSLPSITIPNSVTSIGGSAFSFCSSLDTVICLAMTPPALGESLFYGCDNPTLFVPCAALPDYQLHEQWGQYTNIECISSEETDTEDLIIESGTTTITITWPTEEGADTYTIVIKKDGEVVCTLTFNADGQLLNIAFAPGRDGNHPVQYAEQAGKGFRFTVTGLEEGVDYTYDVIVKDANNKNINTHSGRFTTQSHTAVDNVTTTTANIQKILRDGQLIILRDGVEYNAMGQEIQ